MDFTGLPDSFLGIEYDVGLYFIKYEAFEYDFVSPTEAAGLVAIPSNYTYDLPMMTYGHGLTLKNYIPPSSLDNP